MTRRPVIITRAQPGANQTAERVRALGLAPIVSPALTLALIHPVPSAVSGDYDGLIFTSANGVRFFAEVSQKRDVAVWCVGPATATIARETGFKTVHDANGNARDLAALIKAKCDPSAGRLLHVANTAAAGSLQTDLLRAGFKVSFVGLYEPLLAGALTSEAHVAVTTGQSCVLIHSAKGAASFASLVHGIETGPMRFVCVSEAAASPLSGLGEIHVASRPNEDELLRVLQDVAAAL